MPVADHQATIHFISDAYDPKTHGLNGRRMAGESFLRGYVEHMGEGPFFGTVRNQPDGRALRNFVAAIDPDRRVNILMDFSDRLREAGTVYHPSLSLNTLAWARMPRGADSYALCGITHTTATRGSLFHIADLLNAPLEPWDAVICTSEAVRRSVETQFGFMADYQRRRFGPGAILPAPPMLPVIPLGIRTADFAPDAAKGRALREKLGIPGDAVLAMVLARLTVFGKFDPIPLFMAMQKAANIGGQKLHLLLVGRFALGSTEADYRQAAKLMPDVTLHIFDGAPHENRIASLSGADIFLFPIDNLQETFGLAPIEAMAAGLPVVATDWDGLRDTVSPDCGFLVPTLTGSADHSRPESLRYLLEADNEPQFQSLHASMTVYDTDAMAIRIDRLARDPALRRKMGQAGQDRARRDFDWQAVIPRMKALWAEQAGVRKARGKNLFEGCEIPVLPAAFANFAAWPVKQLAVGSFWFKANDAPDLPTVAELIDLRQTGRLKRSVESPERLEEVLDTARAAPGLVTSREVAEKLNVPVLSVERAALWLAKYDLLELA